MKPLNARKKRKKTKPVFARQESNKRIRLKKSSYRKPRGYQSKQRIKQRGKKKTPSVGYSVPKSVKGFHASGLKEVLVKNLKDVEGLNPKETAVRISHTVGKKKKLMIIDACKKAKLRVLNFDIKIFKEGIIKELTERKKKREKLINARKKKPKTEKKKQKKAEENVEKKLEVKEVPETKQVETVKKGTERIPKKVVRGSR